MLAINAKRLAPALLVAATLSLSGLTCSSAAIAQTATTAQAEDPAAVLAARDYLEAIGYRSRVEAKLAPLAKTKMALKIMLKREPILEDAVAKTYAARLTAQELRDAGKFFRSATGALYFSFNIEMNSNPYVNAEIYRTEVAKRFNPQQRAEVFAYVSSAVGQKMQRLLPDLVKAEREASDEWGAQTQKAIDQAIRTGEEVS